MTPRAPWFACALLVASACASIEPLPREAQVHHLRTSDGWELELVRYAAEPEARGRPVLLCHGINSNGRNMDLDASHSIARWFAAHGREAWTVSLRLSGRYFGTDGGTQPQPRPGYDFDSLVDQDLPAAVAYVKERSSSPLIDFVGHSMGGMALYGYLGNGGEGIGAAAVLGSPARLDFGVPSDRMLAQVAHLLPASWILPMREPGVLSNAFEGLTKDGFRELLIYNPQNTPVPLFQRLMSASLTDVSVGLLQQLSGLMDKGAFTNRDGTRDYREQLKRVRTPMLVVAGKRDRLATVPAVRAGYEALGGEKEWRLIGVENGAKADYAHIDLVIGDRAPTEVWGFVLDFFERHARTIVTSP